MLQQAQKCKALCLIVTHTQTACEACQHYARQAHAPVQISECFCGGQLREVVHNLTLELDLEMVVSILTDVAAAMAYLHQHPPTMSHFDIAHQPLCSAKVLPNPVPSHKLHSGYACRGLLGLACVIHEQCMYSNKDSAPSCA